MLSPRACEKRPTNASDCYGNRVQEEGRRGRHHSGGGRGGAGRAVCWLHQHRASLSDKQEEQHQQEGLGRLVVSIAIRCSFQRKSIVCCWLYKHTIAVRWERPSRHASGRRSLAEPLESGVRLGGRRHACHSGRSPGSPRADQDANDVRCAAGAWHNNAGTIYLFHVGDCEIDILLTPLSSPLGSGCTRFHGI